MDRLRNREIKRNNLSKMWLDENGEYTNDFLEWCKTYWLAKNKSMVGTYAEQQYQIEVSKSRVLKLDSSKSVEELYDKIFNRLRLL
jgi:hypothetical protein